MPKVGVIGSLVWDEIHGRDLAAGVVEEWGGIAYALASFDASLPEGWEIVPLIKVGADLAGKSREFLGSLRRLAAEARCVEVPAANNRVVLYYESAERRSERMAGGVPGWTWADAGRAPIATRTARRLIARDVRDLMMTSLPVGRS